MRLANDDLQLLRSIHVEPWEAAGARPDPIHGQAVSDLEALIAGAVALETARRAEESWKRFSAVIFSIALMEGLALFFAIWQLGFRP
jgi:hypothetical protein